MKPWEQLGETTTPGGTTLALTRRDTEYVLLADGYSLMSSRAHGSEESLAELACARLQKAQAPSVLVGGLGMGYTLRAALDRLPKSATVVVAELLPAVVEWNRGPLGPLAGHPLDDPRVEIDVRDVMVTLRTSPGRFDAVLLDVDNGPDAFFTPGNAALYGDIGLATIRTALKPGGVLAVWAVREDRLFPKRLRHAGFQASVERVRKRTEQRGPRHTIYLGVNKAPWED